MVVALLPIFIAFDVGDHDELSLFGSVDILPFLNKDCFALFQHKSITKNNQVIKGNN